MNNLSNFVETLSELMLINNLNTKELAERVGIDSTSITKYFTVGVIPKLSYAITIADYFECSLDYLFGLVNEYKKSKYVVCQPFYQSFQQILSQRKCTKYRIAKDLHFSNQSTIAWYHGKSIPNMGNLIKMSEYFGCSLDELVGRREAEQ